MYKTIFQLKAIVDLIKENNSKNLYHKLWNAMKGNTSGMTVELISEIERIVEKGYKEFTAHLKKMKSELVSKSEKAA